MPGYVPERKKYTLNFDETTEYAGLVVVMTSLPLGDVLAVQAMQTSVRGPENVKDVEKIFQIFARNLVEWNVCRPDGTPVPADYTGVEAQDIKMLTDVMGEWMRALNEVPAPLDRPSTSGPQSPEELISTVSLSPSLAS